MNNYHYNRPIPYLIPYSAFFGFLRQKTAVCFAYFVRFIFLLLFVCLVSGFMSASSHAEVDFDGLFNQQKPVLTTDQVFQVNAYAKDRQTIIVNFTIVDGYYLYQDKFGFTLDEADIISMKLPKAETFEDIIFGHVLIYRNQPSIQLNTAHIAQSTNTANLSVTFQGCSDLGICYPVITKQIPIDLYHATDKPFSFEESFIPDWLTDDASVTVSGSRSFLSLLGFLGLGLLMAFTPCIFPLLPIALTLITGRETSKNHYVPPLLGYCLGFVLIYLIAAIIVNLTGALISSLFQSNLFLIIAAIIYVLLGIAMFGLWSFDLSSSRISGWLDQWTQSKAPAFIRGFMIGLFSALISTPCITPPLAATLLYVATSQDIFWGMLELGLLALGMTLPLLFLAVFGNRYLPKSGPWMLVVQKTLGLILIAMAFWFIMPILPPIAPYVFVWLFVLLAAGVLGLLTFKGSHKIIYRIAQMLLLAFLIAWPILYVTDNLPEPETENISPDIALGSPLASLETLRERLDGKPGIIFFKAAWCRNCPKVASLLSNMPELMGDDPKVALFSVDLTQQTPENTHITQHFHVFGPPALILVDQSGIILEEYRLNGLVSETAIQRLVAKAIDMQNPHDLTE